jgi:hypothetical protein
MLHCRHGYGKIEETMDILKVVQKGKRLDVLERLYVIYIYIYREIISLGDENTANARWEPAGTFPVTRQLR